jgi:hypothetical protein
MGGHAEQYVFEVVGPSEELPVSRSGRLVYTNPCGGPEERRRQSRRAPQGIPRRAAP